MSYVPRVTEDFERNNNIFELIPTYTVKWMNGRV